MNNWTIWGNQRAPVVIGTEEEVKDFLKHGIEAHPDYYLQDPEGNEWEYNEITGEWTKL